MKISVNFKTNGMDLNFSLEFDPKTEGNYLAEIVEGIMDAVKDLNLPSLDMNKFKPKSNL